jgi:EAL domain-containing protein (putative c-di-GMP-specific phosphodiesterase class I)
MVDRLLIVDDEASMGTLICRVAKACGFDAKHAATAELGLALIASWQPTHLVLDLQMPDMDGIELLRHLAALRCGARIVIASGHGSQVLNTAQRLGIERGLAIEAVLPKPFEASDLRILLARLRSDDDWLTEGALAAAIAADQLLLHYQPKIAVQTRAITGFEALVRWAHPERGLVPPVKFIDLAESSGLMEQLTDWVLNAALKQMTEWKGHDLCVGVNVSVSNLKDVRFADHIERLCRKYQVETRRVCIEVTETSAMSDAIAAMDILARLNLKGFPISIDDFGTGHSSLIRLLRMPISEIKIDQSFVKECHLTRENFIIVKAIVDLAHNLGMTVIAEGVENDKILSMLAGIGCDLAQGYHISKPMPASAIMSWSQAWMERHTALSG